MTCVMYDATLVINNMTATKRRKRADTDART
jgi:hypothetical protein